MSNKVEISVSTENAMKNIQQISYYTSIEDGSVLDTYTIERLGAIIACAEFERDLLRDIQKNKPEILARLDNE